MLLASYSDKLRRNHFRPWTRDENFSFWRRIVTSQTVRNWSELKVLCFGMSDWTSVSFDGKCLCFWGKGFNCFPSFEFLLFHCFWDIGLNLPGSDCPEPDRGAPLWYLGGSGLEGIRVRDLYPSNCRQARKLFDWLSLDDPNQSYLTCR